MAAILEVRDLSKRFGGIAALRGVNLDAEMARITAVIGPNGAGKTTLFNLIAGVYPPTKGEVRLKGQALNGLYSHQRVRLGVARTFQAAFLFHNMSVIENVMTGRHTRSRCGWLDAALRTPRARREEEDILLEATRYLNLVGLGARAQESAAALPFGQQRLLAVARALATEPLALLLDEPGAGLNALEKAELADLLRRVREMGVTVLLVEHDMDLVMRTADWVVVLDYGEKIAEGTVAAVQKDRRVIAAYLGEDVD